MKKVWFVAALLIVVFAIYGSFGLVLEEYRLTNICPKILGIPACYIVLVCFVGVFIAHVLGFDKSKWVYFGFAGIVTLIASTGTIGELTGLTKCPRTPGGTPMCFISLGICLSLITTKILELKSTPRLDQNTQ